jgi:multidrug/hemolysin transport system ATP-binding protein
VNKIIEVTGLKKSYGSVEAVKGIDFYVEKGSLFAFLGPNGAGKSTTIDMLSTLLLPDEGNVIIDNNKLGKDDDKIRGNIGIVFQDHLLDDLLTVKENLLLRGGLYHLSKIKLKESLALVTTQLDMESFIDRPYGKLSGGQKRRADIARALMNRPNILILDEPTTGLDPETRLNIWNVIKKLQIDTGMTIFLTTHYMEEASSANYVVVIDKGEIVAKGTPTELKEEYSYDHLLIYPKNKEKIIEVLKRFGHEYELGFDHIKVVLEQTLDSVPIINECEEYMSGFQVMLGTMDDAFINITRRENMNELFN